jgi:CBS domain-containing protein
MKVEELMRSDVKSCRTSDTIERAAQIMWDHDCGCVPVLDDAGRLGGIITDRDVCMGAYTQGRPLREVPVSTAMSKQVWYCRPDDPLSVAEGMMQEKRIRRLPVVDAAGRLVGIISINDIARKAARERMQKRKAVSDAEVGETLAAICEPRAAAPVAAGPAGKSAKAPAATPAA